MTGMEMDRMDGLSMNLEQANLEKLRSVFPECVSEGKLETIPKFV